MEEVKKYLQEGKLDKAIKELETITKERNEADAYQTLGVLYYEKGSLSSAEQAFISALNIKPDANIYNNLGVLKTEQKDWQAAIEYFNKALELDNKLSFAYSNLGSVYLNIGKQKEAQQYFINALKYDPDNITAHYCLGIEYKHKGEVRLHQVIKLHQMVKIIPPFTIALKDYDRVYNVEVLDYKEDTITISAPLRKGVPVPFREGTILILGLPKHDALYGFYGEIITRIAGRMPKLVLKRPETIRRIQRRKYVRIDGVSPVTIKVKDRADLAKVKFKEKNISAGGILLLSNTYLEVGTILTTIIEIEEKKLVLDARVVRINKAEEKREYEIGCEFINITEAQRVLITKYVYKREIELKKKGLL